MGSRRVLRLVAGPVARAMRRRFEGGWSIAPWSVACDTQPVAGGEDGGCVTKSAARHVGNVLARPPAGNGR